MSSPWTRRLSNFSIALRKILGGLRRPERPQSGCLRRRRTRVAARQPREDRMLESACEAIKFSRTHMRTRDLIIATAVLSLFASVIGLAAPANAATFSWSYSGTGFFGTGTDTGSGTLTTGGLTSTCGSPPVGSCSYVNPPFTTTSGSAITSITGTWDGFTITGLVNPELFDANNNVLYLPPNGVLLDASANGQPGGLAFFVSNYTGNNVPIPTTV